MPGPTLQDLLAVVGPGPRQKAQNTTLQQITLRPGQKRFIFLAKSREPYSDPEGHLVSLLFPNLIPFERLRYYPQLTPLNRRVRVFCGCPAWALTGPAYWATDYKYRLPEAKYAEDRFPTVRDPQGHNPVCKHVVRVAWELRNLSFPQLLATARGPKSAMHAQAALDSLTDAITDFLTRAGQPSAAIQTFLQTLTPDTAEDALAHQGLLCPEAGDDSWDDPESPSAHDWG